MNIFDRIFDKINVAKYKYLVMPESHFMIEVDSSQDINIYQKTFGGIIYDHFPYIEYGYEDPYNFSNDWTMTLMSGDILTYEVDENDYINEVLK